MKRYLVTGGAGFIGSHLACVLANAGHEVTVIDNLSVGKSNLSKLKKHNVRLVVADIRNYDDILPHFKNVDLVYHLAAMNRAPRSVEQPVESHHVNITGTVHVLEAMRVHNVPLIVFASSSSVYAGREGLLKEDDPLAPPHPYGVGKLAAEHYFRIYSELYGLNYVTLRFFSVFGPGQLGHIEHAAVIPKFVHLARNNLPLTVYGDGSTLRNYTHVRDVVRCCLIAGEKQEAQGQIINIANPNEVTIKELTKYVKKHAGVDIALKYLPVRKGDPPRNAPDLTKAKRVLKFAPEISIEKGIKEYVDWYDEEYENLLKE